MKNRYAENHFLKGNYRNEEKTYVVRVKRTKEILDYFRGKWTAELYKDKWAKIVFEECEVIRNPDLIDKENKK